MHEDRYLGSENIDLARELYQRMATHPILSPHGHVDPAVLLSKTPFTNPVDLLITPDHYITRMLISQGVFIFVSSEEEASSKTTEALGCR